MLLDLWFHHNYVKPKTKPPVSVSVGGGNGAINYPTLMNQRFIEDKALPRFNDDELVVLLVQSLLVAKII